MNCFRDQAIRPFRLSWYAKKPQVTCRIVCLVFSLVVIGCVATAKAANHGDCPISNVDSNTCNYEFGLSVVAILAVILFLYFDIYLGRLQDFNMERKLLVIDIIVDFVFVLLWFIGFWYLISRWSESDRTLLAGYVIDNVKAGLAFSFLCILSWGTAFGVGIVKLRVASHTVIYDDGTSEADYITSNQSPTYVISNSAI
ncbi:uncharacterized protein TRIADDRAFT_56946 [Trichoplax adhaerens]|uniref:MARVEL domain-containing protein n=1 Tax=Trichoplax adhaerens TaxID=10228 RepID=B3RX02_TRIAD|nr:hypothetical protein TRIADDRAFT_56946 [Trichoplax adhaerens]EDV25224.1 hypothetical protein TRIADDRAFT_56946 [Trichoplax adhaerens]|eukprot:XP_002113114.1 hypothetical protein TRIADDRAFT_56946 [Trichoplax adhaerens]